MSHFREKKALLALVAGAAVALSMPGLGIGPFVFVALVPLFAAIEKGRGFLAGFLAGVVFFAIDLRWLLTLYRFSWLVVPGYLILVAYLAAYFGLFCFLMAWVRGKRGFDGVLLVLAPLCFTLLEILRAYGPLGIGFSALYLSLYRFPPLIQIAAVAGPWAITAAIVCVNASLYLAMRKSAVYFLIAGGIVGLLAAFSICCGPQEGETLAVAVVSSAVPQEKKLDGRNLLPLLEQYITLGEQAARANPDLIVFPESILPGYILRDERLLPQFRALAEGADAHVLFGTGDFRNGAIYNSVVLLSPDGTTVGMYDMVHPVPFGEYIPGRGLLERIGLGRFANSFLSQDLARGEGYVPVDGIGTPICFEATFPTAARALVKNGAVLLVTVTNDAWFTGSSELRAHFAAAVFRAVETRRTLIQAANGGVSGIVDPHGRILDEVIGEGILFADVVQQESKSLYSQRGNSILYVVLGTSSLAAMVWKTKRTWSSKSTRRGGDRPPPL